MKKFLAWLDAFFDGEDRPTQRVLLLREPAHLWTTRALDRCLWLALIYPVTTIFLVWAISGAANGPVEQALKLNAADGPHRLMAAASIASLFLADWWMLFSKGWHKIGWMLVAGAISTGVAPVPSIFVLVVFVSGELVDFLGAGICAFTGTVAIIGAQAGLAFVGGAVEGASATSYVVAVVALVGVLVVACAVALAIALAIVVAVGALLRGILTHFVATPGGWRGKFLIAFISFMFLLCLAAVRFLPAQSGTITPNFWHTTAGPALLFLGLLPLVNAPFDWLSLGLTRLLLRFGIEQGGPWPWVLRLSTRLLPLC